MKTLPPGMQAHLDSGATTLCWCWRITRRTGERLGFTDHDRTLVFDETTFEAASGFTASEIRDQVGLGVGNLEVESALTSAHLSEDSLASGDFDDAAIEIFRVNWTDTAQRVLMRAGSLGEVRRTGAAFTAEVRGLAHYLQQPKGRLFQYACDADLGDARCGIDISSSLFQVTATVIAAGSPRLFSASGLEAHAGDWFTRGLATFASGSNAGRASEIRRHAVVDGGHSIELWQPMGAPIQTGDAVILSAGCDKHFATCCSKFANGPNYRGFPHMPGNDFLASPPRAGDAVSALS